MRKPRLKRSANCAACYWKLDKIDKTWDKWFVLCKKHKEMTMDCPKCQSQDVEMRTGEKNGKKWTGYFCQEKACRAAFGRDGKLWGEKKPQATAEPSDVMATLTRIENILKRAYPDASKEEVPF